MLLQRLSQVKEDSDTFDWLAIGLTPTSYLYQVVRKCSIYLHFGSICLLMRALTQSRLPHEHSRKRGVSPSLFAKTESTFN